MKKKILRIAVVLFVLVLAAIVAIGFFLDSIIKGGVETVGPKIAGVDVKLNSVSLSLLSGGGKIKGLVIGNPEGFKTKSAIQVGTASLAIKPGSLLSDKIVVQSVNVESPEITFEGGLKGNNLSKILENIEAVAGGEKDSSKSGDKKSQTSQKKIQVNDFSITGGKINLSMTILGGKSATVPLPDIHLKDLGTGSDGITPTELAQKVFSALLASTTKAVAGAIGNLGKEAAGTAKDVGQGAVDSAGKATKKIGDLFKKK